MNKAARVVLPLVFIAFGGAGATYFMLFKPKPQRANPEVLPTRVQVEQVSAKTPAPKISAQGTLMPANSIVVQPEVTGRVVWVSPNLKPGGRFAQGENLLRLDSRVYALAVKQAEAQVERAQFELTVEKGRQKVAQREWKLVGKGDLESESTDLALRRPHLKNAQASLLAAQSALERARLDVSRATIKAPFNAMVREESIDIGQVVAPGSRLATLVGTDKFWVQLSVPVAQLALMDLPNAERAGSVAKVVQDLGLGEPILRQGKVVELMGELDPKGRMARLLVEVQSPLGTGEFDSVPLLLGAFVRVELNGRPIAGTLAVPRAAVREGDVVWVMNNDHKLEVRQVQVAWRSGEQVYLRSGVKVGDKVVTSRVGAAVPGMALRTDDPKSEARAERRPAGQTR